MTGPLKNKHALFTDAFSKICGPSMDITTIIAGIDQIIT